MSRRSAGSRKFDVGLVEQDRHPAGNRGEEGSDGRRVEHGAGGVVGAAQHDKGGAPVHRAAHGGEVLIAADAEGDRDQRHPGHVGHDRIAVESRCTGEQFTAAERPHHLHRDTGGPRADHHVVG